MYGLNPCALFTDWLSFILKGETFKQVFFNKLYPKCVSNMK